VTVEWPVVLFVYSFAAFGLAYIAGHARISLPIRQAWQDAGLSAFLLELVECPACFGFWIGVGATVAAIWLGADTPLVALLPFYTSGSNYVLGRATGLIAREEE
jgi:hypothetical protein